MTINFHVQPTTLPADAGIQINVDTGLTSHIGAFSLFTSPERARQLAIDLVAAAEAYEKAISAREQTLDMFRDAESA